MANIRTKIYDIVRLMFSTIAPLSFQRLVERFKERKISDNYISDNSMKCGNEVICMIDGKVKHGGLTDRINGIVSCYNAANIANRKFKIFFSYPFNLLEFLVPNEYDWSITPDEVQYNVNARPLFIRSLNPSKERKRGLQLLHDIKNNDNKQIHVYSNINSVDNESFHHIFNKLFIPSVRLNDILDEERKKIGCNYISATFRFQQLLNDFKEGDYKILSEKCQKNLKSRCLSVIETLHFKYPDKKILVTSDSKTFLNTVVTLPYVYVISGKMVHMEYNDSNDFFVHVKAFIDLFLISEADIIHSVVIKPMYESGFPRFASKINNRPFKVIHVISDI